jgi:activator of 2-hydroxyglutaryl-CoA dehydratase/predicted nucleotide-binding protein (sugar kinase/HSP70/actin superfamily)
MNASRAQLMIGLDVGSTTVKAVVTEAGGSRILWRDYQRHETRQPEKVFEFLSRIEKEVGVRPGRARTFLTGSGGAVLAPHLGARFVQEVTAVSLAVEKLHPEVYSVIELGGQDAKIIIFKDDEQSGRKKKIPSMNDKCAGGTGAVIDKINAKLRIPHQELCNQCYRGVRLHKVAGKCGVFAETDINSLQKQGTPPEELMASLFDAIVLQNLSVLTRGHTLLPHVLLLGGPNSFIRGMREAWQANIPRMWEERRVKLPEGVAPEDLIRVPENAQYFGALGAVEFGLDEHEEGGAYRGLDGLRHYIDVGRHEEKAKAGSRGLVACPEELAAFRARYGKRPPSPVVFAPRSTVRGVIGVDGGSTSTKAVLLDENGNLLVKAYQLSHGNPIQDTIELFDKLRAPVESTGGRVEVLGVATTGYAKDILRDVLKADVALVETVAHTEAAKRYFEDPHVIVDVGGQDIKLIILSQGRVKDFKLNTQCSAGNGYFLQSTAEGFGLDVQQYADLAFSAETMPVFGYGCAVFLQSDIVGFQRQGWRAEEILAGLAAVLPKNVFLYVANIPNLAALGTRFILQGGTQNNLAVVKAEVDFIRASFRAEEREPEILVHPHCGESGAIGAALEALRLWRNGRQTTFIGLDAVRHIEYRTTRSEQTRCHFCKNACLRTFIDIKTSAAPSQTGVSALPLAAGEQRLIIANCEKGTVEDVGEMRQIKASVDAVRLANPNLPGEAAREVFRSRKPPRVADPEPVHAWTREARRRRDLMRARPRLRIGIPRVLNMYAFAPLFTAYLESLGVATENLVWSDYTTNELYRAGISRGAIDPCFPSKVALSHVHNLLVKATRKPLDVIFFPMFDLLPSPLEKLTGRNACPTVMATPQTVRAAFVKETDVFAERGIRYLAPLVNLDDRRVFSYQMFTAWAPLLGLSREEHERALDAAFAAQRDYDGWLRRRAREVIEMLERERRLGIVVLGRPYHHDPGINHEILDELQKMGYPILSQSTLPLDEDILERLFGAEVRAGVIESPLEISDVWKNSYSCSSNHKLWAAKFTARHPNLVALELSSFKCGHDSPIYSVMERIIERSGTPYFSFKDLDENKPAGSIRIRLETIDYFLRRYRDDLLRQTEAASQVEAPLAELAGQPRMGGQAAVAGA